MAVDVRYRPVGLDHAVVIGGSMAGLLAARVLADHFARVTILDRDQFPQGPAFRKGVPQARHVHVLLTRGQMVLEDLFPGLQSDLAREGAVPMDWIADTKSLNAAGWVPRFSSRFQTHVCSRDLLEWCVRRRLGEHPNVEMLGGCEVTGVVAADGGGRVVGVRLRRRLEREHSVGNEEQLAADLVVDASGRDSRAPEWLAGMGYSAVAETVVNSFLGYATRSYERPGALVNEWKLLLITSRPPENVRAGVILPVEGGRWIVTVSGASREYPPTDEEGFLAFARGLPTPIFAEAITPAQPLSPIYGYRRTENRVRHYERLRRWPDGFVVLGDAVCCFNPVYGQGMSVAALAAQQLDAMLRSRSADGHGRDEASLRPGAAWRFQRALARANRVPWLMATGEDFRFAGTEGGRRGALTRLLHRYMDGVQRVAARDPRTLLAFIEVAHLLRSPLLLFQPRIVLRVVAEGLRRR